MVAVYQAWLRLRAALFSLLVRPSFGAFGRRSVLQPPCRLSGTRGIHIGDKVTVGPHCWLQVLRGPPERSGKITIGSGTSAAGFVTVSAAESVTIESDVLLARYVYIADHAHAFADPGVPIKEQGISNVAPVCIKSGAWLGQGVVICPGVTIGRNAVIGANSVVRQDIPDYAVAAGAPARVIRIVEQHL